MTCPSCSGRGFRRKVVNTDGPAGADVREVGCEECDGTGYLVGFYDDFDDPDPPDPCGPATGGGDH